MRKIFTFIFTIMLIIIGFCFGCNCNHTPQKVYKIGIQYVTDSCDYIVSHDSIEERFVFEFIDKDSSTDNFFNFIFTYNNLNSLRNSAEFTYYNNSGEEILFDENGYYVFNANITIYISYRNANQEIKSEIANRNCNISLPLGTFIF